MEDLRTCLQGRWMHSHEEDTTTVTVYRPAEYKFPQARGRTGFEFISDGRAVYLGIAAADGSTPVPGHWETPSPNQVRITADHDRVQPMVLNVLSCELDRLTVSR